MCLGTGRSVRDFFRNGPRSDEILINFSKLWKFHKETTLMKNMNCVFSQVRFGAIYT